MAFYFEDSNSSLDSHARGEEKVDQFKCKTTFCWFPAHTLLFDKTSQFL